MDQADDDPGLNKHPHNQTLHVCSTPFLNTGHICVVFSNVEVSS